MKIVKINFCGFWDGFDKNNNIFVDILSQKYIVEVSDNPDYVFFAPNKSGELKYFDGIRIFYTGENIVPDFNIADYGIGFDYITFGDRYCRLPVYMLYNDDCERMLSKHLVDKDVLKTKTDFCSFVFSHGDGYIDNARDSFFIKLSEYKKVNSGGKHLNNIGISGGVADKNTFQLKHKFSIAFENTSHDGYTTEKLVQSFAAKTIPIYWGDPRVSEVFDDGAFVNCMQYDSIDDAIKKIKEIDSNDDLYLEMLKRPALIDANYFSNQLEQLKVFLYNIFDQPFDEAYRRDRFGWGKLYNDTLQHYELDSGVRTILRGGAKLVKKVSLEYKDFCFRFSNR